MCANITSLRASLLGYLSCYSYQDIHSNSSFFFFSFLFQDAIDVAKADEGKEMVCDNETERVERRGGNQIDLLM